ncbi:type IV secretory system conjugative DNA transfer family protein [Crocosphaera sp. Alani8]|uniref:type IV secretory system conjugative DNA transfer family protein n=1 Tax=Crocosphaera sp. Alani8 TaxID=3038952 RepID=UPI00313AE591
MKNQPVEQTIITEATTTQPSTDYTHLLKDMIVSTEGLAVVGCLVLLAVLGVTGNNGTKGKLAKGRLGTRTEKEAAKKAAISQIEGKEHNEVALYIGRPKTKQVLFLPDMQRGTAVIGGPGCGKTDSAQLPMIYSAIDQDLPCLIWDFKYPALCSRVLGYAAKRGYKVEIFAPGYPESSVCNPLDFLKSEEDSLMARQFAETLNRNFKKGGQNSEDQFFGPAGDQLVEAILMLAKGIRNSQGESMGDLMTCQALLSLPDFTKRLMSNQEKVNPWVYASFGQLISVVQSEKTVASIIATANRLFTGFMKAQILPAFCGKTTVDLEITGKKLLVIGLDREKRDVLAPLVATILDLIVSRNVVLNRVDPLMLFLDEVPTLYLPRLVNWLNENREDGLCTILGFQNIVQLEEIYGKGWARAILGACATKLIFNPQDPESAEFFSKLFDDKEITYNQKSRSSGKGGGSTSISEQNQTRKLITPGEMLTMPRGKCIMINPGFQSKNEAYIPIVENLTLSSQYKNLKKRTVKQWDNLKPKLEKRSSQVPLNRSDLKYRYELVERTFPSKKTGEDSEKTPSITDKKQAHKVGESWIKSAT